MHELAVTQSILEIALRHAEQANARRITGLYLVVGELSSLVDDSIQFYWEIYAKDTIAENARLHFKRVPAEMECISCATRYSPTKDNLVCPSCSNHGRVVAGNEFFLDAVDIETDEEGAPA